MAGLYKWVYLFENDAIILVFLQEKVTMGSIMDFFKKNKNQIVDFIGNVGVNHDKTKIKFGYIDDSLTVAFYIHNEPDNTITNYEDKVECLLNAEVDDFPELEIKLNADRNCEISFAPYLKINENPTVHAFQMTVNYCKWERANVKSADV